MIDFGANSDNELTALVKECQHREPRLRDLSWFARKRLVRTVRDKTTELIEAGHRNPDELAELVEGHCRLELADDGDGDFGNPILFALLAAVIHWVVLRLLDRFFPRTEHESYGKGT
jgi:hypothetical protein